MKNKTTLISAITIFFGMLSGIAIAASTVAPPVIFDTDLALPAMPPGNGSGTPVCIDNGVDGSGLLVAGCLLAKGDKGETGDTGPEGPQGIQGVEGPQGIQGEEGPPGPVNEKVWTELCNLYVITGSRLPSICFNCGSGTLEPFEQCDDGNTTPGDGCNEACVIEACGDGKVDVGEQCDDGNTTNGDGCNSKCVYEPKTVFVTNKVFTGNLRGLSGADSSCNVLAGNVGLAGKYTAWLSTTTVDAKDRFTSGPPYQLVGGVTVASSLNALLAGKMLAAISLNEFGEPVSRTDRVWTSTKADGTKSTITDTLGTCNNWNSSGGTLSLYRGVFGNSSSSTNSSWTYDNDSNCSGEYRLYCFEQ